MFFASTMLMVSIALVMAVIVTNIYAKKNTSQRCPAWAVSLASRIFPTYSLPERESNACLVSVSTGKDATTELQGSYTQQRHTPPSRPRSTNAVSTATPRQRGTNPGSRGVSLQRGTETVSGGGGAAERRARRMQRTAASLSTDSTMYPRQNEHPVTQSPAGNLDQVLTNSAFSAQRDQQRAVSSAEQRGRQHRQSRAGRPSSLEGRVATCRYDGRSRLSLGVRCYQRRDAHESSATDGASTQLRRLADTYTGHFTMSPITHLTHQLTCHCRYATSIHGS